MDIWDRELERTQAALDDLAPWPQNVALPNGLETAPELRAQTAAQVTALLDLLPRLEGKRILDLGCLSGAHAFALAEQGAEVLGIEPDPRHIKQARWLRRRLGHHHHVRFREAPVYALARVKEQFDVVLMTNGVRRIRYPPLAIDLALEKADEQLILPYDDGVPGWPSDIDVMQHLESAGARPSRPLRGLLTCETGGHQVDAELLAATGRPINRRIQETRTAGV